MRSFTTLILLLTLNTLYAQPALQTRLDAFFHTLPSTQPGFALSIEKNGKTLYQNAVGIADTRTNTPIDPQTNFRMASVTKQFTAMGILLLEKDGALSVDDPLSRWLPELPKGVGHHVHIRHLLTHSSGILDYESLIPPDQSGQLLDADVLKLLAPYDSTYFPPGSRFRYSNSGFCLLALIIERASRQSYARYLQQHIFLPLHMDSSAVYEAEKYIPLRAMGYSRDSMGNLIPSDQSMTSATKGDGGVYTSLSDYTKWINALRQNRLIDLPAALHRLRFPIATAKYYAAGWFINTSDPPLLFHSGSTCGFNNYVIRIPRDSWNIVCFSNMADNRANFAAILRILKETGNPDLSSIFQLHDLTR
jgi:CubicO group peptidase (beta-lactamase class C family)